MVFEKSRRNNEVSEQVIADKRGANKSGADQIIDSKETAIVMSQVEYLTTSTGKITERLNVSPDPCSDSGTFVPPLAFWLAQDSCT